MGLYRKHLTEEFIEKNLCRGIEGARFVDSDKIKIGNRFMIALLYAFDSKLSELAEYVGCNIKQVERWCYGKTIPKHVNMKKVTFYFNVEEEVLFGEYAYRYPYKVKHLKKNQEPNVKFRSNKSANIKKPLLYGLLWLYKLKPITIAEYLEIGVKDFRKILYTDELPNDNIKNKLSFLFSVPQEILFADTFRTRTAEKRASNE